MFFSCYLLFKLNIFISIELQFYFIGKIKTNIRCNRIIKDKSVVLFYLRLILYYHF